MRLGRNSNPEWTVHPATADYKMNRQDAGTAKEIESLEKGVIGTSMGFELRKSTGQPELEPVRKGTLKLGLETYVHSEAVHVHVHVDAAGTCTCTGTGRVRVGRLSISQIIVPESKSKSGSFIEIDPCPGWNLALMERSTSLRAGSAAPGFSSPNPITRSSIPVRSCPTVTSPSPPWRSWRLGG